jgi:hypothetical protein
MRKTVLSLAMAAAALLVPTQAFAWGAAAHQMIMRRAIDLLPPDLKPFFDFYAAEIVLRVNDPDLWRNVPWDDDANHFVDFGVPEYGKPPFTELPRDYDVAVQKFGVRVVKRNGTLPWRVAEMFGNLRRGFEGMAHATPYGISDVTLFAAVLGHYLQDATQPFHATDNFDGARTGNNGIHSRFERDLFEMFESKLHFSSAPPSSMTAPRDFTFDTLVTSYGLVDSILAADKAAVGAKDVYDAEYFQKFFESVQPVLEQQLNAAAQATAGAIVGAWEQAGRPKLYTAQPRPPQRVRR